MEAASRILGRGERVRESRLRPVGKTFAARVIRLLAVVIAAVSLTGVLAHSAGATTLPAPQANVQPIVAVTGTGCGSAVSTTACTDDQWLADTNHARSLEGLTPIILPYNYESLAPNAQLLVLTNLERSARGLTPIFGTETVMDQDALNSAKVDADPLGIDGGNWAEADSALNANYTWVYYDAIVRAGSPWGHRDAILQNTNGVTIDMGGAVTSDNNGQPSATEMFGSGYSTTYDTLWSSITIPTTAPAPVIVNTSSTSGAGGATITLYGNYFTGATAVDFGTVAGTNVHVLNDSELTVTVPVQTGLFSPANITVTTPTGTSLVNDQETYTYPPPPPVLPTVTSVSPNFTTNSTATTPVTISGTGFTGVTSVSLSSGQSVSSYTVNSPTSISAVLPSHPEGTGDETSYWLVVTTASGSSTSTGGNFTWYGPSATTYPPVVWSVSPASGASATATPVTITREFFTGATTVTLSNGLSATNVVALSPGTIDATIPANPQPSGASSSATINVTTPAGTSSSATTFTWVGPGAPPPVSPPPGSPPPAATPRGYYLVGSDGGIFAFGGAPFYGSTGSIHLNQPIVGMAVTPDHRGYWFVAADGGIFAYGDAGFYGSTGGQPLPGAIVGMAATPDGRGYWLVGSDGSVYAFGDAGNFGSMRGTPLNRPIVGMAATTNGGGYYLVATDGGLFSFGNAAFKGSMGGSPLNRPIVGMATDPTGGYYEVASDGGIFSFGGAAFHGSTGSQNLNRPIVGITVTDAGGYQMVASDGGLFSFGDATFDGSMGGAPLNKPIVGMA